MTSWDGRRRATTTPTARTTSTAWVDWNLSDEQRSLLKFTQDVIAVQMSHPVFRRRRFFAGDAQHGGESALGDIAWFTPAGKHMTHSDWSTGYARVAGASSSTAGRSPSPTRAESRSSTTASYIMFNASHEDVDFTLPPLEYGQRWTVVLDTGETDVPRVRDEGTLPAGSDVDVTGRSLFVVTRPSVEAL